MPILVRPVREQLEHDRIIRLLLARYKRKHDAVTNVGGEPPTAVVIGTAEFVPDVILLTNDKARKLEGVVEVETGESVNSLETLAQWGPFSRLRVPFHLYVPPHTARHRAPAVPRAQRHGRGVVDLPHQPRPGAIHADSEGSRRGPGGGPQSRIERHAEAEGGAAASAAPAAATAAAGAPPVRAAETKAPLRTAAQKAALGKFVAAAAKASAAKSAAAGGSNVVKPAPARRLRQAVAAGKPVAAKSVPAKAAVVAKPPAVAVAPVPAAKAVAAKAASAGCRGAGETGRGVQAGRRRQTGAPGGESDQAGAQARAGAAGQDRQVERTAAFRPSRPPNPPPSRP